MKPPFSYYGGKQRIVRHIIPHIPQHTVYVEPFCGGATLLFEKPDYRTGNSDHYREVINDTNKDVYNFFVQLRDNGEELCRMLDLSLYSQELFKKSSNYEGTDDLMRSYYFFVNIMQSFGHRLNSGWGTCVFNENRPRTYFNKCLSLRTFIERMQHISISCEDAIRCIERWDSPQTFLYCDPPYPGTNQGHYKGYTQEDYNNLVETLNNCEGSFILSCYDNECIPNNCEKYEFETVMSASRDKSLDKKRTECIWVREARVKCRKEIDKVYEKQTQLMFDL